MTNISPAPSAFAGSAQMLAQLGSSSMSRQQAMHDRENVRSVEQSMAKHGQQGTTAPAIAQCAQTFASSNTGSSGDSGIGDATADRTVAGPFEDGRPKGNSDAVLAELAEGYALSGLSQAVIRDVGPPTAVQVGISAPDKL